MSFMDVDNFFVLQFKQYRPYIYSLFNRNKKAMSFIDVNYFVLPIKQYRSYYSV